MTKITEAPEGAKVIGIGKSPTVTVSDEDKTDFQLHVMLIKKQHGLGDTDARAKAWAEGREKFNQRMGGLYTST